MAPTTKDSVILSQRQGQVLSQNTLLKVDYYFDRTTLKGLPKNVFGDATLETNEEETLMSKKKEKADLDEFDDSAIVRLSGAQNFRTANNPISKSRIYGVAQPTVGGIRAVLNHLEASEQMVTWVNLREEPLVYINDRPFVLREKERPFQNLPYYSGISLERLEDMEERLKSDILNEAKMYKNNLLIHEEITTSIYDENSGLVSGYWESISKYTVKTPKQVFEELRNEGYSINYYRIPLTAEQDLTIGDYDQIVEFLRKVPQDSKIVFNCQLGKTRSTHAMVIAWLYDLFADEDKVNSALSIAEKRYKELFRKSKDLQSYYNSGEYRPIQELIRTLKYGIQSKDLADVAIDNCGLIRNLREVIASYKTKADKSRSKENRLLYLNAAFRNLSRYYHLVSACDYLREMQIGQTEWQTFSEFLSDRSEQLNIINSYDAERALEKPQVTDDYSLAYSRDGKILSRSAILKSDHFFQPLREFKEMHIDGAPNFRKLSLNKFVIYGCSTPNEGGFNNLLDAVNAKLKSVRVINLREEAVIYINGQPFNLRDVQHPFTNINLEGISAQRLQDLEETLKQDCVADLQRNKKLLLHDETDNAELISFWEKCDQSKIQTTQEVMDKLVEEGYKLNYLRIPVTPLIAPEVRDLESLLSELQVAKENGQSVLLFDHFGLGRAYLGTVIAYLYAMADDANSTKVQLGSPSKFQIVSVLLRMLPDSRRRYSEVNHALEVCKLGASSLDIIGEVEKYVSKAQTARTVNVANMFKKKAVQILKKYLTIITFNSYLHDQHPNYSKKFNDWLEERSEISRLLIEAEHNPDASLKIDVEEAISSATEDPLANRNGEVLAKNTVLKKDHFPGCQRMNLLPRIDGAPNYRKIPKENEYGKVYGVAIPTVTGIENVLHYLSAKKNKIVWINLREEPLIYVAGTPYTLRESDKPFSNIEQAGIATERLILMEQRLKQDILQEGNLCGDRILVHDENEKLEAYVHYLPANEETVLRLNEVYDSMKQKGYNVTLHRVPITDERAPEPSDFDTILRAVVSCDVKETYYVCNCQQGRGRTTTCIVIMCLINTWRLNAYSLDMDLKSDGGESPQTNLEDLAENLRNGNYKVVQKLMRVLKFGKQNKRQVDTVLDDCSQMQNLRTAIYDTKLMSIPEANTERTKKHMLHYERAIAYLERYLYLIIFNEYLHEEMQESEPYARSFDSWLASRAEITNILSSEFDLE